jgi:hypothetical protein
MLITFEGTNWMPFSGILATFPTSRFNQLNEENAIFLPKAYNHSTTGKEF